MNIYFSGIGGVALGPLAEIARDAGHTVTGSDPVKSLTTTELERSGIAISTDQTGEFLSQCHAATPIDWFVYTSALPVDHPELLQAKALGIAHVTKRDELIRNIVEEKQLTLVAIAGTHGKTTTTTMLIWTLHQLKVPVSYSVGSTLSFAPSGAYVPESRYFVYECDEFDRNFLHFSPELSLISSIDYDHSDTYPTKEEYRGAFEQFIAQSTQTIAWKRDLTGMDIPESTWRLAESERIDIALPGVHNRANATLVLKALDYFKVGDDLTIRKALESFPGSQRRFEKLAENLYSDYGHHPVEIAATLQLARELSEHVVLVYQPHQNIRQHEIRHDYISCMEGAEQIFWLPTYLSREDPKLAILTPEELTQDLTNLESVTYTELNDDLWQRIIEARSAGKLVLCMGAGSIDAWIREKLTKY